VTNESFFAIALTAMIAMFFGFIVAFGGYRFFLILLPIWGFFWGFGLGANSIQALLGENFLVTITGWVVGLIVGIIFALLSYLFYFFAVALIAGSLGYALAVGILLAIGIPFGFIDWIVGIAVGVIFAIGAIVLNVQKWVVIIATSILGAGIIVGTFLYVFGRLPATANPVQATLQTSPFWVIVFLVIAALGIAAQYATTRHWEVQTYNRVSEVTAEA